MVVDCLELSTSEKATDWVVRDDAHRACLAWLRENGQQTLASALKSQDMSGHLANVFDHLRQLDIGDRYRQCANGKRVWIGLQLTPKGQSLLVG
jgi:hypothetical protein